MGKDVTRHIEEQLSAFLDGELPEEELELLVRRVERDESYRATLDRYALIGGVLRNDPQASAAVGLRRGIMQAIDAADPSEPARVAPIARRSSAGYLLAASLAVGVLGSLIAVGFNSGSNTAEVAPQAMAVVQPEVPAAATVENMQPAKSSQDNAQSVVRARHQRELNRIRVNQERMRSYLISHGGYSRPLQGAMADSSMYVQQASFTE